MRQVGQEPSPPIPGKPVTTYYEVSEALVTEGMWKAGMGNIKDNDDLYLYAIMVSIDGNGNVRKGPFYTLDEIKRAEPWAHPDDLDDYFGIHVPYRSADFPVDIIAKTVGGKVIQKPEVTFLKGKYKVGETIDHEFPETIEDNGKTYTIVRSYLSPKQDPTQKDWLQENPETNPKVRTRSFTVHLGGTDAIAEYAENNPVKAIYQKEDGTKLKEVDKGVFATGEEANHTFEGQITSGGQTYEIIRSYITNNNKPDEKLFMQEKNDPKLKERSILVGSGGSNFIGIYKIPSSAAGIAHEIRNPLTAIRGFLQLMKTEGVKPNYFEIVFSEFQRIELILAELLILAKPHESRMQRKDIIHLLRDVVTLMGSQALMSNVLIRFTCDLRTLYVICDENQMKQVFINILKNAIDAMPDGGEARIEIHASEKEVQIVVIDHGCGIPADKLMQIGQPFFTSKKQGTGLGMMMSFKIIENHGGSIHIESVVCCSLASFSSLNNSYTLISKAVAIFSMVCNLTFFSPLSIWPRYVGAMPIDSANCSWVKFCSMRYRRILAPTAFAKVVIQSLTTSLYREV